MPHRAKWTYNGEVWPSVNEITGLLRSEALDRWLAVPGNKAKGKEAQRKGTGVAKVMEKIRKGQSVNGQGFPQSCIANWLKVQDRVILEAECHLVNTFERYHGSPDAVECDSYGDAVLVDDKVKKRFAAYNLLLNEHLYAACNMIERNGILDPVPWEWPIKQIVFNTFDPDTGELYINEHEFNQNIYNEALTLRKSWNIAQTSEAYFKQHATLLPSQRKPSEPIIQCTVAHPKGLVSDPTEAAQ